MFSIIVNLLLKEPGLPKGDSKVNVLFAELTRPPPQLDKALIEAANSVAILVPV